MRREAEIRNQVGLDEGGGDEEVVEIAGLDGQERDLQRGVSSISTPPSPTKTSLDEAHRRHTPSRRSKVNDEISAQEQRLREIYGNTRRHYRSSPLRGHNSGISPSRDDSETEKFGSEFVDDSTVPEGPRREDTDDAMREGKEDANDWFLDPNINHDIMARGSPNNAHFRPRQQRRQEARQGSKLKSHRRQDDQDPTIHQYVNKHDNGHASPDQIPLSTLLKEYILLLVQDKRNIAVVILSFIVLYLCFSSSFFFSFFSFGSGARTDPREIVPSPLPLASAASTAVTAAASSFSSLLSSLPSAAGGWSTLSSSADSAIRPSSSSSTLAQMQLPSSSSYQPSSSSPSSSPPFSSSERMFKPDNSPLSSTFASRLLGQSSHHPSLSSSSLSLPTSSAPRFDPS